MYKCDIIENSRILWIRFLPTKKNKVVGGLEKEIYAIIMDIVKKNKATTFGEHVANTYGGFHEW